ncbi:unnamed protein product [Symbiodinium natans]|uniref:Uncharacterized protein n=1 Tax=Symbiodinium natans TaxID=878477 RepID=A0A812L1W0_9DINO|nr:unnamed protein product [Symbiodinium natans]
MWSGVVESISLLSSARQLRRVAEAAILEFDHARVLYPEWASDWAPIERNLRKAIQSIEFVVAAADDPLQHKLKATNVFLEEACQAKRRSILLGIRAHRQRSHSRTHSRSQSWQIRLGLSDSEDEEEDSVLSEPFDPDQFPQPANPLPTASTLTQFGPFGFEPVMTRIGSAWRELQAMQSHDAF